MENTNFNCMPLSELEAQKTMGGSSCPNCAGGLIGRAIGYTIRYWATIDYRRMPVS